MAANAGWVGFEKMPGDRVALVTGATGGIGLAIARELASVGMTVVAGYHANRSAAEALVGEIEDQGGKAFSCGGDVREPDAARRLSDLAIERCGRIDALICSAGVVRDDLAPAMPIDDWDAVIDTNLRGVFLCIREVSRHMMAQKGGSIVNISSVSATHGGAGQCNYAASKGGINAMTRALAVELSPRRIRVNAVAPGVIVTDMSQRVRNLAGDTLIGRIPLRRFGAPEEVAKAVRFLVSDDASYITGEVLHVSGGYGI